MTPAAVFALIGSLGGVTGVATLVRSRAQNRLDRASAGVREAEADSIEVRTAREMIGEMRAEMDRRVSSLDRELGRLRGHLEGTRAERDQLRDIETQLRDENHQLRLRVESLEQQ